MKKLIQLGLCLLICAISYAQTTFFVDPRDGQTYNTVKIVDQLWMTEHLRATTLNDSTPIPLVSENKTWQSLTTPAYCWYFNDSVTYKKSHGALYNWYTVNTGKLCPTGWHVPTEDEWFILMWNLGMPSATQGRDKDAKKDMAKSFNNPKFGVRDNTGHMIPPGGWRDIKGKFMGLIGVTGYWWSSTETDNGKYIHTWGMLSGGEDAIHLGHLKNAGCFVKCLKD